MAAGEVGLADPDRMARYYGGGDDERVFAYQRRLGATGLLIVLNFTPSHQTVRLALPGPGRCLVSTVPTRHRGTIALQPLRLLPDEGLLVELPTTTP
jgi:hypothetical protein